MTVHRTTVMNIVVSPAKYVSSPVVITVRAKCSRVVRRVQIISFKRAVGKNRNEQFIVDGTK